MENVTLDLRIKFINAVRANNTPRFIEAIELGLGANINNPLGVAGYFDDTPLLVTVKQKRYNLTKILLDNYDSLKLDVNVLCERQKNSMGSGWNGLTPFLYCCGSIGDINEQTVLLFLSKHKELNLDLTTQSHFGNTALMYLLYNHPTIVPGILEKYGHLDWGVFLEDCEHDDIVKFARKFYKYDLGVIDTLIEMQMRTNARNK
jgi:hypothetical protein